MIDARAQRETRLLQARARLLQDERAGEFDLCKFMARYQPDRAEPTHMMPLVHALDRTMHARVEVAPRDTMAKRSRFKIIAVEAPPRHWKTSVLQSHAARLVKYRPSRVAYCTYANDIAFRRSREVRELAARAGVWIGAEQRTAQQFDPSLSVAFWQTDGGGQFVAGGRHGQWIGEGFDLVMFDDPLKDPSEAESETMCNEAFATLRMLMSRLEPGATLVLSQQRWNENDPIGRLKDWIANDPDAPEVEIITLRAIEQIEIRTDEKGNERITGGVPLCPQRYDLPALIEWISMLGLYGHANLQQDVTPRGKRLFPDLARYDVPEADGSYLFISCDPGIEGSDAKHAKKKEPDPSGIVVAWAYLREGLRLDVETGQLVSAMLVHVDIILAEQLWLEPLDLLAYLEELQTQTYAGATLLLEEVAAFRLLELVALRTNQQLEIVSVLPRGSKLIRSLPTAAAARAEPPRVRVPANAEWVPKFLKEVRTFTGKPGRRDNMVDALTQLYDQAELILGVAAAGAASGGETILVRSKY